jgi:hypothetical protein
MMAFSRAEAPLEAPSGDELTASMVGIGMRFAATPNRDANLEDTLLFASKAAMDQDDLRVLSTLVTWFGVHHPWVNADRLSKLVLARGSDRVQALWNALSTWQAKDRRFARLQAQLRRRRIDVLEAGADFQIRRYGEDPRFEGTCLRVPGKMLRDRADDVLAPEELVDRHRAYRCRVMMGPNYRADLWAALEADPTLSPSELARRTYASFASAWQVKRDFAIAHGGLVTPPGLKRLTPADLEKMVTDARAGSGRGR